MVSFLPSHQSHTVQKKMWAALKSKKKDNKKERKGKKRKIQ
jgi:hypothetical protein